MFYKKLISTALSALTIFPAVAPLVSANGSSQAEQPQPSNTSAASAPESAETGTTTPPAQKRPRQAEPQSDTAAKTDSESERKQLKKIDFHLQKAHACLDVIENFGTKFMEEVAKKPQSLLFSYNNNSEFMDELYTKLGELIVHLDVLYYNATFSLEKVDTLQRTVDDKLANLQTTILGVLKSNIMRLPKINEDYKKIQMECLKENEDLYNPNNGSMVTLLNIFKNCPKDIRCANTLFFLYEHFVLNFTMKHIRDYFLSHGWDINKPIVLNPKSANEHLKDFLSSDIRCLFSRIYNLSSRIHPYTFHQIACINKILSLEIFSTNFDTHPNILLGYLDKFESYLTSQPITNSFFITNYLEAVYCRSPIYQTGTPPKDIDALKLKLRNINTLLFKKIEEMNFEKFPKLQEILQNILGQKNSLFAPDLSPDDYYDNFTKKIIEYSGAVYDSSLHVRLYKLSVLADILLGIQCNPTAPGIRNLFEDLEWYTKYDISKIGEQLSKIGLKPKPEPESESESESESEIVLPFELEKKGVFLENLISLEFFNDLIVQPTPPQN